MKKLATQLIWLRSLQKPKQVLTTVALLGFAFLLISFKALSQITIHAVNAPIETIFKTIEKQSDYVFFYKSNLKNIKVTVDAINAPVKNVLNECFRNLPFKYKIVDKTIVITEVAETTKTTPAMTLETPVQNEVIGRVSDSTGAALQGVSVVVKGQSGGTMTDANGHYKVNVDDPNAVLVFSYVGMVQVEVPVSERKVINVTMIALPAIADEVILTGFFRKNKSSYTGSAATFTGEELKKVAPTNVFEAISMLTQGLSITEKNNLGSNPNAIPEILVRGVTSFANNSQSVNQPLIVRDGTIINIQDLYDMDINEIATVTILKDASAAALYGAKAANGVIVIERNKMAASKMKVIYNFTGSMQFPDFGGYDILNSKDKLEYEKLAGLYTSANHQTQQSLDSLYNVRLMDVNRGVFTDWMSKPSRIGYSQDHSLRLTGGAGNTRYELNARYGNVEGVMENDFRKRYGLGFALEYNTTSGLTFTNRTRLAQTNIRYSPYGSFSTYTKMNPYDRTHDSFGELYKTLSWDHNNPLYEASLGSFSKAMNNSLSNDFDLRWKMSNRFIVTSHLNFTLNGGNTQMYTSPLSGAYKNVLDLSKRGSLSLGNNNGLTYSGNVVVSYNERLPKQSMLIANLGGNFNRMDLKSASYSGVGFYADALRSINFASSYPTGGAPGGYQDLNADVGAFLNTNYIFRNRYYFDGVYQVSGSSKFGANNRYSQFWSAGLGWNLHNESFLNYDWLNILKLRASTGYTGKVSFDSYQALTTYRYNIALNYLNGIGAIPVTIGNPDLTWERTMNYNAGIDVSLWARRVNFSADFYIRKTNDLLIDKTFPPSTGTTIGKENLGEIENKGFEFKLDGYVIKSRDWNLQLGTNLTHNSNKILKISDALKARNEANNNTNSVEPLPQFQEGQSTTALKVVRSAGIDPATGKEVFIKLNGERTFVFDPADKVVVGDLLPKLYGNIFSIVSYKRFTAAAYFRFLYDQYIYNTTLATKVEGSDPKYNADYRVFNDRWKNPGDIALYRDIADQSLPYQTTRFVEKENTFSLARLNLSYELDKNKFKKLGVEKASVGVSINDMFRLSTVRIERGTDYLFSRGFDINLNIIF